MAVFPRKNDNDVSDGVARHAAEDADGADAADALDNLLHLPYSSLCKNDNDIFRAPRGHGKADIHSQRSIGSLSGEITRMQIKQPSTFTIFFISQSPLVAKTTMKISAPPADAGWRFLLQVLISSPNGVATRRQAMHPTLLIIFFIARPLS